MQNQLYPKEAIDHALETYLPKVNGKSQIIYSVVLISTICAFLILPFVFVDVSVSSPGVIRTLSEKTEIKSLVSGRISKMAVVENQIVNTGDVLFAIATEELDNKIRLSVFDKKENLI